MTEKISFQDSRPLDTEENILKDPTMDYRMNTYMERSNKNDPTCIFVDGDEEKRIDFHTTPKQDEVIYTIGLCGCIASAFVTELRDGTQKAIMTHNPPSTIEKGGNQIILFPAKRGQNPARWAEIRR